MTMPLPVRKFELTAHVTSSVGWLGAVVVFMALGVVGLTSQDAQTVRGSYLVMEPITWFVLVPLTLASLLTGLVQSMGTTWGLFRHYWVLFKLLMNIVAAAVLLLYTTRYGLRRQDEWRRARQRRQAARAASDVAAVPAGPPVQEGRQ